MKKVAPHTVFLHAFDWDTLERDVGVKFSKEARVRLVTAFSEPWPIDWDAVERDLSVTFSNEVRRRLVEAFVPAPRPVDWDTLERDVGARFSKEARRRLVDAMERFVEDSAISGASVPPRNAKKRLLTGRRAVANLTKFLNHTPLPMLNRSVAFGPVGGVTDPGPQWIDDLRATLAALGYVLDEAIRALPRRKKTEPVLSALLLATIREFTQAGGDGTYTPNAHRFVHAMCRAAGARARSDETLTRAITRALGSVGQD